LNAVTASFATTASFVANAFVQNGNSFGTQALLGTNDAQNLALETNGTVRMTISGSNGFVGIGTTSPESLLHIAQSNAGGKAILYIDNNATSTLNNEATIKFSVDAGASVTVGGAEISTVNVNAGNGNADLTFKTFRSGVGLTEKMRIANDGNVGINTQTPGYKLDTRDTSTTNVIVASFANTSTASNTTKAASVALNLTDTVGTGKEVAILRAFTDSVNVLSGGLAFDIRKTDTTPSEAVRITSAGNVGINTTTPGTTLDVNGNTTITGSLFLSSSLYAAQGGSATGNTAIVTVATGSYRAGFFDYTISSGSNARAGTVMSVWNGASVQFTDNSTLDIGDTSAVTMSVDLSGANARLLAGPSTGTWTVKTTYRLI
jgi:hypothetical protein